MYQWFMPNDKFADDPLDFQRFIVGLSYQVNEFLRFAVDSQNVGSSTIIKKPFRSPICGSSATCRVRPLTDY